MGIDNYDYTNCYESPSYRSCHVLVIFAVYCSNTVCHGCKASTADPVLPFLLLLLLLPVLLRQLASILLVLYRHPPDSGITKIKHGPSVEFYDTVHGSTQRRS